MRCLLLLVALLARSPTSSSQQFPRATHRRQEHKYLLSHATVKNKETAFLVAGYTSPARAHDRRKWVRQQWTRNIALLQSENATPTPPRMVMKFAIGVNNSSGDALEALHKEEEEFGDLLLLQGVKDLDIGEDGWPWQGVSATTEKVMYTMQWAVENFSFQYFARLGDDSYFRPDEFYRQVMAGEFPTSMAVIGHFIGPYSFDVGAGSNSVMYPAGMGCVVTHDIAAWVASSSGMLTVGFPEDAVVGSWLVGTQAKLVNADDRFHDQYGCITRDILVHHMDSEADWQRIDSAGVMTC